MMIHRRFLGCPFPKVLESDGGENGLDIHAEGKKHIFGEYGK
jgi:uncharacterized Fe-S cluster-containing protein